MANKPRIGISSCLLGNNVRYDGGNTYASLIENISLNDFEIIPYCPEVEMGLGIPRQTVQLVKNQNTVYMMTADRKQQLNQLASDTFSQFAINDIDGFIFQSRSPSCGLGSTKLYEVYSDGTENLISDGHNGIFASFLLEESPHLPVLDSADLSLDRLKSFLEKVKVFHKKRAS